MGYEGEATSRPRVEFGPAPDAFDMAPVAYGTRDPRALGTRGLCHWLSQAQYDLSGPQPVHTNRSVMQVTGSDGLQTAARFEATFNPHHERLIVHAIRVHRAGEVREAGVPEAFEVIQRELNMERAVYDGRITAHMVIPDVREGDVVEMCHSIVGANPALKGHFAWWFILQWSNVVVETRCTVRVAADRPLTIRKLANAPDPVDATVDGVRTLDWRVIDMKPYVPDRGTPPAYVGYGAVHVADAMTWNQVAEVFRAAYDPPALPDDLAQKVSDLAARYPAATDRLVEGLRMVQGALRYHSVSVGEGGYRPRALDQIWATRYGDCKDGSVLLTGVLRALGINAVCALVNTAFGDDLQGVPPNVLSFNHCIVRARVGDRVLWLDSTLSPQAGDIDHVSQADFDWALPLEAGATLETMPLPPLRTYCETVETWSFASRKGRPAGLEMTTTYRGWRADGVRRWIANEGKDNVSRHLREGLERDVHSPMQATAPVEIIDDVATNTLTMVEHYEVERPFRAPDRGTDPVFYSRDDVVGPTLPGIGPDRRREPLALGLPRRIKTTRVFRFPTTIQITPWTERITGPAGLEFATAFEWRSQTEGVQTLILQVTEPMIATSLTEDYRAFLTRAQANNGISFVVPFKGDKMSAARKDAGWVTWAVWFGILAVLGLTRFLAG
ncbi:DUF3857 domain-containing protein [Rhizobium sp. CRIBSB]|nr:DUF3857 domain-containing protein [Rhizobium sp. CRIBSB]